MTQPAGQGATIDFRFRNGTAVEFVAHEIKVEKLLDDVKAYLKFRPRQLDWQKINVGDLGYRLVSENQKQYLGPQVARGSGAQAPRRSTSTSGSPSPRRCKRPGPICSGQDGRRQHQLHRRLARRHGDRQEAAGGKTCYFVADAATGKPVAKANVEFFGWQQQRRRQPHEILIKDFAEFTDADGQVDHRPRQRSRTTTSG